MKRWTAVFLIAIMVSGGPSAPFARADAFEAEDLLFMEIPVVVTASRQSLEMNKAPATVYVLTSEDIKASGALTVADALRQVPGVDVLSARAADPQVSIRGMNHALANNTLVLLDGKSVLMGYFDTMVWETLPVTLDEIDRIEVVEGPASALYGANALNGVINIITKTPDQLKGGSAAITGGERRTRLGSLVYGRRSGKWDYKFGTGWNSVNQFENASRLASNAGKVHSLVGYEFGENRRISFSGGLSNINTEMNLSYIAVPYADGPVGFVRGDVVLDRFKLRTFWNHSGLVLRDAAVYGNPKLANDDYNVIAEQTLALFPSNELTFGGEFTHRTMRSGLFGSASPRQDLWASFFEDTWRFRERWLLVASGRLDHHPLTGHSFSPRGSVIFTPAASHAFRVSGGTSFKYPNLVENYLDLNVSVPNTGGAAVPNPPYSQLDLRYRGNQDLDPQRLAMVELAHSGDFGRLRTTLVGFHYKLKNIIDTTPAVPVSPASLPPVFPLDSTYYNHGEASALGGEFGGNILISRGVTAFANYSYQSVRFDSAGSMSQPKHKVNGGVRYKRGGFSSSLWVSWVDKTFWNASVQGAVPRIVKLKDYTLVNAHAGYAFPGRLRGMEIGLSVFNLGDHKHYQILPSQGAAEPGRLGEVIRSRVAGTLSYRF